MRGASMGSGCSACCGTGDSGFRRYANVSIVDVQESAIARALWDRIAKDYEAEHKGVTVHFKYIEGESYKQKLPTMLQSSQRPDLGV